MQNLADQEEIRVPGCQSCLVKPSCKGRLQLPNAGLFLTPDPLTCIKESSDNVRILPTPLLRPLFEGLKELDEVIPTPPPPPRTDGRCPSEFAIALKVEFSKIA